METEDQRRERLKGKGWIAVDLDGTLAEWHGWAASGGRIGAPIATMVKRVKTWLSRGIEVRIFTARAAGGMDEHGLRDSDVAIHNVQNWCITHIGRALPVTNVKDHEMIELWDDRAIQVERNTGRRMDGVVACEMIDVHSNGEDTQEAPCAAGAIGVTEDGSYVCERHGQAMVSEGFAVAWKAT